MKLSECDPRDTEADRCQRNVQMPYLWQGVQDEGHLHLTSQIPHALLRLWGEFLWCGHYDLFPSPDLPPVRLRSELEWVKNSCQINLFHVMLNNSRYLSSLFLFDQIYFKFYRYFRYNTISHMFITGSKSLSNYRQRWASPINSPRPSVQDCGKRCRNNNELQEHKRARHGLMKIHKCSHCEYSSATKEALTVSILTHGSTNDVDNGTTKRDKFSK